MKHTPLSTADKLMLGDIFKGEQYEFIVHAVNMHESLVEALKKVHTSMLDGSITDTGFDTTFITTLLSQAERK